MISHLEQFRSAYNWLIEKGGSIKYTVKPAVCDPPREQWTMTTQGRGSLNTGLIDMECNVKGNNNQDDIIQVIAV